MFQSRHISPAYENFEIKRDPVPHYKKDTKKKLADNTNPKTSEWGFSKPSVDTHRPYLSHLLSKNPDVHISNNRKIRSNRILGRAPTEDEFLIGHKMDIDLLGMKKRISRIMTDEKGLDDFLQTSIQVPLYGDTGIIFDDTGRPQLQDMVISDLLEDETGRYLLLNSLNNTHQEWNAFTEYLLLMTYSSLANKLPDDVIKETMESFKKFKPQIFEANDIELESNRNDPNVPQFAQPLHHIEISSTVIRDEQRDDEQDAYVPPPLRTEWKQDDQPIAPAHVFEGVSLSTTIPASVETRSFAQLMQEVTGRASHIRALEEEASQNITDDDVQLDDAQNDVPETSENTRNINLLQKMTSATENIQPGVLELTSPKRPITSNLIKKLSSASHKSEESPEAQPHVQSQASSQRERDQSRSQQAPNVPETSENTRNINAMQQAAEQLRLQQQAEQLRLQQQAAEQRRLQQQAAEQLRLRQQADEKKAEADAKQNDPQEQTQPSDSIMKYDATTEQYIYRETPNKKRNVDKDVKILNKQMKIKHKVQISKKDFIIALTILSSLKHSSLIPKYRNWAGKKILDNMLIQIAIDIKQKGSSIDVIKKVYKNFFRRMTDLSNSDIKVLLQEVERMYLASSTAENDPQEATQPEVDKRLDSTPLPYQGIIMQYNPQTDRLTFVQPKNKTRSIDRQLVTINKVLQTKLDVHITKNDYIIAAMTLSKLDYAKIRHNSKYYTGAQLIYELLKLIGQTVKSHGYSITHILEAYRTFFIKHTYLYYEEVPHEATKTIMREVRRLYLTKKPKTPRKKPKPPPSRKGFTISKKRDVIDLTGDNDPQEQKRNVIDLTGEEEVSGKRSFASFSMKPWKGMATTTFSMGIPGDPVIINKQYYDAIGHEDKTLFTTALRNLAKANTNIWRMYFPGTVKTMMTNFNNRGEVRIISRTDIRYLTPKKVAIANKKKPRKK